jgi:hypothetical protein
MKTECPLSGVKQTWFCSDLPRCPTYVPMRCNSDISFGVSCRVVEQGPSDARRDVA